MTKRKSKPKANPFAAKSVSDLEMIRGGALAEMISLVITIAGEPDLQVMDPDSYTIGMLRQHGFDLDEAGAAWEEADAELSRRRREEH